MVNHSAVRPFLRAIHRFMYHNCSIRQDAVVHLRNFPINLIRKALERIALFSCDIIEPGRQIFGGYTFKGDVSAIAHDIDVCIGIDARAALIFSCIDHPVICDLELNGIGFLCSGQCNLVDKLPVPDFELSVIKIGAVRVEFKRGRRQLAILTGRFVPIPEL